VSGIVLAVAAGFPAGVLSGLFGVGGGMLFIPTFVLVLGLDQLEAQASSLAAMVPVALAGTWRQHRYGNVDGRAALMIGLASGVVAGALLAASLPEVVLRKLFAALLLLVAAQLVWSARSALRWVHE